MSRVVWEKSVPLLGMCVMFTETHEADVLNLSFWGGSKDGPSFGIDRAQARELASELLQWAGSDDPDWGPLIPWFGGECPLDEWEQANHCVLVWNANAGIKKVFAGATGVQWMWSQGVSKVIAYRVRKRPPAPVEEWVRRTVVLGEQSAKVEILMRDGKAVDARMAQEGE